MGITLAKSKWMYRCFMFTFSGKNHEKHEAPFGLHEGVWIISVVVRGRSPSANVIDPRNEGREHSQPGVQGITPWPPEATCYCR